MILFRSTYASPEETSIRVKLITFRYSATLGGFDDTAFAEFIRDKEVLSFREHFYLLNDVPHLTCVVSYQDPVKVQRICVFTPSPQGASWE